MKPVIVTASMLRAYGACREQVDAFEAEWPEGTPVTLESVQRALALGLDIEWAAENLLSDEALAYYEAKRATFLADYKAKLDPLWADYKAKRARLWADYEAKLAPLWADYEAKLAPLQADYEAKCARVFVAAWDEGRGAK